jgi:hypothetical protein
MILASPSKTYSAIDQAQMRDALRRADAENHKQGRDVEIGAGRVILTDPATGVRYALRVSGGALSCVAL